MPRHEDDQAPDPAAGLPTVAGAEPGREARHAVTQQARHVATQEARHGATEEASHSDTHEARHAAADETPPADAPATRIVSPRAVRVVAYVVGLALLISGVAAVTFGDVSSPGPWSGQAARQVTAARTDERASRGEIRATASLTPTATVTPLAAFGAAPSPTAVPTTPAVTTAPAPAATTTKPTAKATTAAPATASTGCAGYTGNRLIACNLLPSFGFATSQMSALDPMWDRESGWNASAENPSSGAYGIPQALPGNKMATAGSDWATNPATQIKWGLDYIKQRYGSPAAAWSFWQANGWY